MAGCYHFLPDPYCKLLLHVVKYPHLAVSGILLGEQENNGRYIITDVIPLFHSLVGLTPMLEVAFSQIEAYCRLKKDLMILGYYQANELFNQNGLNLFSAGVGQKILENCLDACIVILSNDNILPVTLDSATSPFKLFLPSENRGWKEAGSHKVTVEEGALEKYHMAIGDNLDATIVDFDNYLDNPSLDWLNRQLFSPPPTELPPKSSPQRATKAHAQ